MNEQLQKILSEFESGKFSKEGWDLIKKTLKGTDESLTAQEQEALLTGFKSASDNDPEFKQLYQQHLKDTATQRFTKQFKPFFSALLSGVDLATSLSQIKTSNQALKSIVQPSIAASPGEPQALKAQLANAQQGGLAGARAIAPAKQQIEQQYQNDLNLAKQVSGGNAGSFMSNAQTASLQKQRAAANLPAIQDAIQSRYQQRADQVAGQLGQLQQQDFGNRLYGSQLALDQYNRQQQAAATLGSAGRLNLRNTLQGIPGAITGIAGQLYPSSYSNQTPKTPIVTGQVVNYPKDVQNYASDIMNGLASKMGWSNQSEDFINTPHNAQYLPRY